jgi:hypothetical protein
MLLFPFTIALLITSFQYGIFIDALDGASNVAPIKEPLSGYIDWDSHTIFYILDFSKVCLTFTIFSANYLWRIMFGLDINFIGYRTE